MQISNILSVFRKKMENLYLTADRNLKIQISRHSALVKRREWLKKSGNRVVNRALKKRIRKYCKRVFGSSTYWPWIALYSEIRGEFIEGWIPDDYFRFTILPKLNPESIMRLSEIKSIDHRIFPGKTITPLLARIRGSFYDANGQYIEPGQATKLLKHTKGEIVIKPDNGYGGAGIVFAAAHKVLIEELPEGTNLLIQKVVRQHDLLNRVYPYSVNTFRVLTHLDDQGQVNVLFINLRFGLGNSRVDNLSSGGGWISITPDGKTGGIAFTQYSEVLGATHPETSVRFEDIEFPFMNKVIMLCQKSHYFFPYTAIIGWDVVVDHMGEPHLLEWNANNPWFWDVEALYGPFFKINPI